MVTLSYNWQRISIIDSQTNDHNLGLRHIIKKLWFVREGIDSSNNKSTIRQVLVLPPPDVNNYISIKNLTKEQLINWVETELGTDKLREIDDLIAQRLLEMRNIRGESIIKEPEQLSYNTPIFISVVEPEINQLVEPEINQLVEPEINQLVEGEVIENEINQSEADSIELKVDLKV